MTAWDVEDKADETMDAIMMNCHVHLTAEERVDFLLYLADLVEHALRVSLLAVSKH